ncbi:ankyrin repeat [Anaeramoeba flamelloides]|uniref:Ankyrin repeat n=1 Tax=Anaeramoeba flamelloides TaxID=1746091 RepID=A0ABQ8YF08_9EUKA|nr:ankyrin repeat [Anaeramoeba flamelloides]
MPKHLGYLTCVDRRFNQILSSSEVWSNVLAGSTTSLSSHNFHRFDTKYRYEIQELFLAPPDRIKKFLDNKENYNKSKAVFSSFFHERNKYLKSQKKMKKISFLFSKGLSRKLNNTLFVLYVAPLFLSLIIFSGHTTKYGWFKLTFSLSTPFFLIILYFIFLNIYGTRTGLYSLWEIKRYKQDTIILLCGYLLIFFTYSFIVKKTFLHITSLIGNNNVFLTLANLGANINSKDTFNYTPLILASKSGNIEIVNDLIRRGADIDPFDIFDFSATDYACFFANYEIVKSLVQDQGINFTKTQQIKNFCYERYLFNLPLYLKDRSLIQSKNDEHLKTKDYFDNIKYVFKFIFGKKQPLEISINKFFLEKRTNQTFQKVNKRISHLLDYKLEQFQSLIYFGNTVENNKATGDYYAWTIHFEKLLHIYGYSQVKNTINGLNLDHTTKDLVIDINGKEILVHKFILKSNSNYFHSLIRRRPKMTIYVDQFNYEYFIWEKLIAFLYRQKLDENLTLSHLNKIENLAQQIQISTNSSLNWEIKKYKFFLNNQNS